MMPRIPIFTSIPAIFIRKDGAGNEIGAKYLSSCINSWRDNSFIPVSINSDIENRSKLIEDSVIQRINANRSAQNFCGKPLVYLSDFIKAACDATNGPVIIVNSDIFLRLNKETLNKISNINPGQCIVSKRIDIKSMDSPRGDEYQNGYDFFAYHSKDLRMIIDNPFVFGLPWWDHFLPIYMFLSGVKQIHVDRNFSYHLIHTTRWNSKLWIDLGHKYISLMKNQTEFKNNAYFEQLEKAVDCSDQEFLTVFKTKISKLINIDYEKNDVRVLRRVARVNEKFLASMTNK